MASAVPGGSAASVAASRGSDASLRSHGPAPATAGAERSEEHTSELQSLMRISYAVFCLKKQNRETTAHSAASNNHIVDRSDVRPVHSLRNYSVPSHCRL